MRFHIQIHDGTSLPGYALLYLAHQRVQLLEIRWLCALRGLGRSLSLWHQSCLAHVLQFLFGLEQSARRDAPNQQTRSFNNIRPTPGRICTIPAKDNGFKVSRKVKHPILKAKKSSDLEGSFSPGFHLPPDI
jgi:hypothetical protein